MTTASFPARPACSERACGAFSWLAGPGPDRIVYTDHWLRREGYCARQIWRAP